MILEFLSKFAVAINRAFSLVLRFFEIQDLISQLARLNQKSLVGAQDVPRFFLSEILDKLQNDPALDVTISALKQGYQVLANPMVDIEHDGNDVTAHVLLSVPQMSSAESFCSIEELTPIKVNISGACYEGPVTKSDLLLITCPYSKHIIERSTLNKCFTNDKLLLCPNGILQSKFVNDLTWLGYMWNPEMKLSHPRYHITTENCDDLPMIYLGERHYLSISEQTLVTNIGTMNVRPMAIYHFPCNITFEGITTSLTRCPDRMTIRLPIFTKTTITYVDWTHDDTDTLQLHHTTINVKPLQKVNKTLMKGLKELNRLYELYNDRLSVAIKKL